MKTRLQKLRIIVLSVMTFLWINNIFSVEEKSKSFNSHTVNIIDAQYRNGSYISSGSTIEVPSSGSVTIDFTVEVIKSDGVNNGTVQFYYQSYSGAVPSTTGFPVTVIGGAYNTWDVSYHTISLSSGMFSQGSTGTIYAVFENNGGAQWQSSKYNVEIETEDEITNNTISGNQTITSGNTASTLIGSTPSGGSGSYSYQWQKKTTGSYSNISGATSKNYSPGAVTVTSYYRRIVSSGDVSNSISNIVTITVETPLSNNTICCSQTLEYEEGTIITGSTPVGGDGNYKYEWHNRYKMPGEDEYSVWLGASGLNPPKDLSISLRDVTDEPYYVQYRSCLLYTSDAADD